MKNSDEHSAKSVTYGKKVVRKKSGQREKQTVQQTPSRAHTHTHTYIQSSIQYTHTLTAKAYKQTLNKHAKLTIRT
jgi:hypothetical protein